MKNISKVEEDTINEIRSIVCEYFNFDSELLNSRSRKAPIPFLKQVVSFLVLKHTKTTKSTLGTYWGYHHANIISMVTTIRKMRFDDNKFLSQLNDLDRLMEIKGISKNNNYKLRNWFNHFDLDNFISARFGDKFIIFKGYTPEEVENLLGNNYVVDVHQNTKHFIFTRKSKNK